MHGLPILTSVLDPQALAHHVEAAYGVTGARCQLITATIRDVYLVESRAGRHVLIVYRHGPRTRDAIAAEWRFVAYLAAHAVPVAPAIVPASGEPILVLQAPEGVRYAVLTPYVRGEHLRRRPSVAASERYGATIARIHTLADAAPASFARATPDIPARLDHALSGIRTVFGPWLREQAYLEQCGQELRARLQAVSREPPGYGMIHGDVIRANALIGDDGTLTVIDFDWYGEGWRAYDIASYRLTVRGTAEEQAFADAFLSGYRAVRPLATEEERLLPVFEAVRAVLEIGTPAQHINLWGSAYLESFFDQSLERLKRTMHQLTA